MKKIFLIILFVAILTSIYWQYKLVKQFLYNREQEQCYQDRNEQESREEYRRNEIRRIKTLREGK